MPKHLATAILPAKNLRSLDTKTLLMVAERALEEVSKKRTLSLDINDHTRIPTALELVTLVLNTEEF